MPLAAKLVVSEELPDFLSLAPAGAVAPSIGDFEVCSILAGTFIFWLNILVSLLHSKQRYSVTSWHNV